MNTYGALKKLMIMMLLSIFGSYCMGSQEIVDAKNTAPFILQTVCDYFNSCVQYCAASWSDFIHYITGYVKKYDEKVKIQNVQDNVEGDRHYCTDGKKDCDYNTDFFRDTWFVGKIDEDPTTHYNVDEDPVRLVQS